MMNNPTVEEKLLWNYDMLYKRKLKRIPLRSAASGADEVWRCMGGIIHKMSYKILKNMILHIS